MKENRAEGPRAVVIGSGIGGSAATLLLAHAGIPVTLIEKNRRLGGSCSGYEKQGFRIDIGTHMFCRGAKGPLGDVLRRAQSEGAIRFVRTHDIAELRFIDPRDPRRVRSVAVPADLARMPRFAFEIARALDLSLTDALRAARLFTYILSMSDAEVASWDHRTIEDFLEPFTHNAPTIAVFGFLLGLYFILPYWQVSAGEALWCFRHMARDNALSYPKGGSIAIPETYVRLAKERGAQVRLGAGVQRVLTREGRVTGVELTDGTRLAADVVLVGIGAQPEVEWLAGSGLDLDDGVLTDACCATSLPGVVAVGDCASAFDPAAGRHRRVEHWTHALQQPATAAATLLGTRPAPYAALPYFWSEQYGRQLQFAGTREPGDTVTVVEGSTEDRSFVATYERDGRLTAVLGLDAPRSFSRLRRTLRAQHAELAS